MLPHQYSTTQLPNEIIVDRLRMRKFLQELKSFRPNASKFSLNAINTIKHSGLFDEEWYRNRYPDLRDAKINLAQHYLEHGWIEKRNPGPEFHTSLYLEAYSDVAVAGMNPLLHYVTYGRKEGRYPAGEPFDSALYLRLYSDVIPPDLSSIEHYATFGKERFYYTYFDEKWYLEEYGDLYSGLRGDLLAHFLSVGLHQGMVPAFSERWYKREYADVRDAEIDVFDHYANYGRTEGRHPAFNRQFYLNEYSDIKDAGIEPFDHYVLHGRGEGRSPGFNPHWYANVYKDVSSYGKGPYEHYLEIGRAEGRSLNSRDIWSAIRWGRVNENYKAGKTWAVKSDRLEKEINFSPLVTIIVPNYNHEIYLRERLESIYNQSYRNFEVLLLDDSSTDQSRDILNEYKNRYSDNTITLFNEKNSGGVFHQWKKGLELARGELIWIAESDDACTENFLDELVQLFQNSGVRLAFSRTDFIRGDTAEKVWTSEEYWGEVGFGLDSDQAIMSAHELVEKVWAARNICANVSSAVFRNPGKIDILDEKVWRDLRICGDWVLYFHLIRGGLVGYTGRATNYYRMHGGNTSTSLHNSDVFFKEHEIVAKYAVKLFSVGDAAIRHHQDVLYRHWVMKRGEEARADFDKLFDVADILSFSAGRKPNIAMAIFALVTGGGETFPILLANELHRRGFAVSILNFAVEEENTGIRSLIDPAIAVIEPKNSLDTGIILERLGVELVHTHHAWVDAVVASAVKDIPHIRHVVTTHGLYEMIDRDTLHNIQNDLMRVDSFVYIADKNLKGFPSSLTQTKPFTKITNTVHIGSLTTVDRSKFGIEQEDFVVCLASRAVPEKGWQEAIDAVIIANTTSSRKIHLLLVGDGPELVRLQSEVLPDFIHLLGFQKNVRGYFAVSDIGLLTSRFKGESCPLVLIECLSVGRPMIATDVGEVTKMLEFGGKLAGFAVPLIDWMVDIKSIARGIVQLCEDKILYEELRKLSSDAFLKFDPDVVIGQYIDLYKQTLALPRAKLKLSVVLVVYNMKREIMRTIKTLSPEFQGLSPDEYEVIIVDNGSDYPYDLDTLKEICPNSRYVKYQEPSSSPVKAFNFGISIAAGQVVCGLIDGARMASPRLLQTGLSACEMDARVVAGSLSFHLGFTPQNDSVKFGYDQTVEDALLATVDWESDGYKLYSISSFDPSSRFGLYSMPAETNALFMSRASWSRYGGLEPEFSCRGGGLVNLDIWRRICDDSDAVVVTLLGEGTFHQFHGGAATNAIGDVWTGFHEEYVRIRGKDYSLPDRKPLLFGKTHRALLEFSERVEAIISG